MSGFDSNDFSRPRETRTPSLTTVELVELAGREVGRFTFEPGWRWSACIKPLAGTDSCQVEHVGYMVSGAMHVVHDDGTTGDMLPGAVYHVAPGHDAWVTSDEPAVVIEFGDPSTYAKA